MFCFVLPIFLPGSHAQKPSAWKSQVQMPKRSVQCCQILDPASCPACPVTRCGLQLHQPAIPTVLCTASRLRSCRALTWNAFFPFLVVNEISRGPTYVSSPNEAFPDAFPTLQMNCCRFCSQSAPFTSPEHSLLSDLSVPLLDSWREPNMTNSPGSGQHCRY